MSSLDSTISLVTHSGPPRLRSSEMNLSTPFVRPASDPAPMTMAFLSAPTGSCT